MDARATLGAAPRVHSRRGRFFGGMDSRPVRDRELKDGSISSHWVRLRLRLVVGAKSVISRQGA
jgi:hypothetical protein